VVFRKLTVFHSVLWMCWQNTSSLHPILWWVNVFYNYSTLWMVTLHNCFAYRDCTQHTTFICFPEAWHVISSQSCMSRIWKILAFCTKILIQSWPQIFCKCFTCHLSQSQVYKCGEYWMLTIVLIVTLSQRANRSPLHLFYLRSTKAVK